MRTLLTIVHTSRRRRRREYLMCWEEAETYKKIMRYITNVMLCL